MGSQSAHTNPHIYSTSRRRFHRHYSATDRSDHRNGAAIHTDLRAYPNIYPGNTHPNIKRNTHPYNHCQPNGIPHPHTITSP